MNDNLIQFGEIHKHYNTRYTCKYTLAMYHTKLNEHKIISALDEQILKDKVALQAKKWSERWRNIALVGMSTQEANEKTKEAEAIFSQIDNAIINALSVENTINWKDLKSSKPFSEKKPVKPEKPAQVKIKDVPPRPIKTAQEFTPTFTFLEKVLPFLKRKKVASLEQKYFFALSDWEDIVKALNDEVVRANKLIDKNHDAAIAAWTDEVSKWEMRKAQFIQEQNEHNVKIENFKNDYLNRKEGSLEEYCELVLSNSQYPDFISKRFELEYNAESKVLIVEYEFPALDKFPRVKEVKFIASRKELKPTYISDSQLNKMFDDALYKITLRTLHELFSSDVINAIDLISFNGWVNSVNSATGKDEVNCVLSIQVSKTEFNDVDLSRVEPKSCFKKFKGVSSSKLSSLTPIQPLLQISKSDRRFVDGHAVVDAVDEATNLAAMDWEDFEHLIRELFEKEFQSNGGEVKVTQASRDGGVDAIAFDPDPIRGGKIVIQAKRYTNTVSVSAVRDLYGTVMNEGATKGILVSTADYGPDAYDFAKGKPLTLLNGSNLLHLLQKHGHHAKIDLKEAKKLFSDNSK